jgi:acyl carrier protein
MTIEDFIEKVVAEFPDIEPDKLTPDVAYRDVLKWSSINALILIAMIITEYDVIISADDLKSANTLKELFAIIQERIL